MFKKIKRFDIFLAVGILALAGILFLVVRFAKQPGNYVVVTQGKNVYGTYSLAVDGEYEITSFYGHNILTIKDGEAYMSESSCPDHICERMGHISKMGETVICLPNEVFVKITNHKDGD